MATAGALKGSESEGKPDYYIRILVTLKLAPLKTTHFGLDMGFPSQLLRASSVLDAEQFTLNPFSKLGSFCKFTVISLKRVIEPIAFHYILYSLQKSTATFCCLEECLGFLVVTNNRICVFRAGIFLISSEAA